MDRIPEPELMTAPEQARAYAEANFEEAHGRYPVLFRDIFPNCPPTGHALDLGCGPGDVTRRFARALPDWSFDAVDGSPAMLAEAHKLPSARIHYIEGLIPDAPIPRPRYELVMSSSLLHHLHDPAVLWTTIRQRCNGMVFVVDLRRPESRDIAQRLVDENSKDEPEILRRDFYNSLLAAFTVTEVEHQLKEAGLSRITVQEISDRHLLVAGFQIAPSSL